MSTTASLADQPRVLVVDDEENISFLVSSALHLAEIEVKTAADDGRRWLAPQRSDPTS